jgi:hypothetical protein
MKKIVITILAFLSFYVVNSQTNKDSLEVTNTLEEIITVCNSALPEGENQTEIIFERLAPYIVYTGTDAAKNNKVACDYNKSIERKIVDKWGLDLKKWLDLISEYKVTGFKSSKNKDNQLSCTLNVGYKPSGKTKVFEFIKISDKFLLTKFE